MCVCVFVARTNADTRTQAQSRHKYIHNICIYTSTFIFIDMYTIFNRYVNTHVRTYSRNYTNTRIYILAYTLSCVIPSYHIIYLVESFDRLLDTK